MSLIKVRAVDHRKDFEDWYQIWCDPEKIHYIEPITAGDWMGHYVIGFNNKDFILNKEDFNAIMD